jgi:hypothetical protein
MANVRDKHRKKFFGVFTGEEFQIKKIKVSDFMQHLGALPAENTDTLTSQLKLIGEKIKDAAKDDTVSQDLQKFYLEHGVVSPRIFFGPYDECPEDQIHFDDLADDAGGLINAIAEFSFDFSEFKKKMEQVLQQQQPDTPGHAGEEVRQITDGDASAGNST